MLAGGRLLDDALNVSGLTMRNEVQKEVLKLANKQGVKVHQTKMKVDDPVDVLKDLGETPKDSEIACLTAIVSRMETDMGPMQARARAWAWGMLIRCAHCPTPSTTALPVWPQSPVHRGSETWLSRRRTTG